jgi:hypothetical protein
MLEYLDPQSVEQMENQGFPCSANLNGISHATDAALCNDITKLTGPSLSNKIARTNTDISMSDHPHHYQLSPHQTPNTVFANNSALRNHSKEGHSLQVRSGDKAANLVPDHHQAFSSCIPDANTEPPHERLPSHHHQQETQNSLPNSYVTKKSPRRTHSKENRSSRVRSDDKTANHVLDHRQGSSLHMPDVSPVPSHVPQNDAALSSNPHRSNIFPSNMDLQSLLEHEEVQDKELDEAQENRRKCEIEERIALKAYRKAQRATFEADAKCIKFYRQREIISAQIRSLYLNDSSLFWPSRSQNQVPNMHLLPSSSNQMQCELDVQNQYQNQNQNQNGTDLEVRRVDNQQKGTQDLASNTCSESDASTSDLKKGTGLRNGICSPSNESNTSEYEEGEILSAQVRSSPVNQDDDDTRKDLDEGSRIYARSDDSLLLEASLRSKLFTRLGIKQSSQERHPIQNIDSVVDRRIQNYVIGEESETSVENLSLSELGREQHMDLEGSASFLSPIQHSAFEHLKISDSITKVQSQTIEDHQLPDICEEDSNSLASDKFKQIIPSTSLYSKDLMDICVSNDGYYANNLEIDPFWPLCMFELRGKCNNDECSLQHVRDYSDNADCGGAKNLSMHRDSLARVPPTYIICLDVLGPDKSRPYESVVAGSVGRFWRKCFSLSLVFSSLLLTDLPSDEPFLHGTEACVEVHRSWNRQSSHFHSRRDIQLGTPGQHLTDYEHSLEKALLNLNQEVDKHKRWTEALKVLARALEADPSCEVLWVVYLHIYYSNQKSIGEDDLFHCAVEHNKRSYELWLMYINSRVNLTDCLTAYKYALSSLCTCASTSDTDSTRASAAVLDLFLQMINCMCISGNIETAIQTIYDLYPVSNIITTLTIHDKIILSVCCIYFFLYKKLPSEIVHSFEFRKERFAIEWPYTNLTVHERKKSIKFVEMAVDSLVLHTGNETMLESAYFFAVNHIRCTAVLRGLEHSRTLLEKYIKRYPSSLELMLMSAHAAHDFGDSRFLGFEDVLLKFPGAHLVWNQYAEAVLRSGKLDLAREIMDRWFQTVQSQVENLDMLGQMNLSLHRILQDDPNGAISAVDSALESASPNDYKQSVVEHASFFASMDKALILLNRYFSDTRIPSTPAPLSRNFMEMIMKPKVRQLVSNLLTPLSSDFFLMNSVLKVWYGPSFLPSNLQVEKIVEIVEAIMENRPANYLVAVSLCKVLAGDGSSSNVSKSISFWASSVLVNALFQAVPVAPEHVWVEAASVLTNLKMGQSILESFHRRAVLVYPFSLRLWESFSNFSKSNGNANANEIVEAAKERGVKV